MSGCCGLDSFWLGFVTKEDGGGGEIKLWLSRRSDDDTRSNVKDFCCGVVSVGWILRLCVCVCS